jgi:hypothetical protein
MNVAKVSWFDAFAGAGAAPIRARKAATAFGDFTNDPVPHSQQLIESVPFLPSFTSARSKPHALHGVVPIFLLVGAVTVGASG